jgi:hypothetical protein
MNYYRQSQVSIVLLAILAAACTVGRRMSTAAYAGPAETPKSATAEGTKATDTALGKGALERVVRDPRLEQMAKVLVQYSVAVKKGDVVVIETPPRAEPLVIALFKEIVEAGGHPHVRMQPPLLEELLLRYGSEKQLKYVSPLDMHTVENVDVRIMIWSESNTRALTNVDPARQALRSAAQLPVVKRFLERAAWGGNAKESDCVLKKAAWSRRPPRKARNSCSRCWIRMKGHGGWVSSPSRAITGSPSSRRTSSSTRRSEVPSIWRWGQVTRKRAARTSQACIGI